MSARHRRDPDRARGLTDVESRRIDSFFEAAHWAIIPNASLFCQDTNAGDSCSPSIAPSVRGAGPDCNRVTRATARGIMTSMLDAAWRELQRVETLTYSPPPEEGNLARVAKPSAHRT